MPHNTNCKGDWLEREGHGFISRLWASRRHLTSHCGKQIAGCCGPLVQSSRTALMFLCVCSSLKELNLWFLEGCHHVKTSYGSILHIYGTLRYMPWPCLFPLPPVSGKQGWRFAGIWNRTCLVLMFLPNAWSSPPSRLRPLPLPSRKEGFFVLTLNGREP